MSRARAASLIVLGGLLLACKGKERLPYPYGLERNAEACNIDEPHPTPNEKALANPRTRDAEVARLWQGENSGARPACKSPHGAFDMTGNVDEWVVNESGHPSTRRPRSCARHTLHIPGAAGAGSAKQYVSLHISAQPRVWRKMCRDTYYFRVGAPPAAAAAAAAAAESADVGEAFRVLRRIARLFLFGAVVITSFDGFHTFSATTEYASPWILKTAWWVPLLYGSTVAFGGLFYDRGYRMLRGPERLAPLNAVTNGFFAFGVLYFASGFLPISNGAKLVLLVAGAIVVWGMVDQTAQGVALAVVIAIAGCTTEIVLTRLGAVRHLQADVLGIPIWLPGLYLVAAPAIGQLARRMLRDPEALY